MKKIDLKTYNAPVIEVVDVEVEKGFATSSITRTGEEGAWQ